MTAARLLTTCDDCGQLIWVREVSLRELPYTHYLCEECEDREERGAEDKDRIRNAGEDFDEVN